MKTQPFHIVALGAQGSGVSGGDRIFIEIAKRIQKKYCVHLWLNNEGKAMCERMNLSSEQIVYHISSLQQYRRWGSVVFNLAVVFEGIRIGLLKKPEQGSIVYSASEFWMDCIPTLFWKLKDKSLHWIASWYQTAPSPFKGFSLAGAPRDRMAAIPYWFFQQTTKPFISRFADKITVNNAKETNEFIKYKRKKNIFIMYGAVDTELTSTFQKKIGKLPKKYAAVFQGRFHPQKGVLELIDIWKIVVQKMPNAKLILIGDGPLKAAVEEKITEYKLQKKVILLGYVFDGMKKYKTFIESKLVVHPAFYDSGGMASAEAMAFGLPCIGFDLPSYKDYYPKGMLKVKQTDIAAFADAIIKLLSDKALYSTYSREAQSMVLQSWGWNKRVADFEVFLKS